MEQLMDQMHVELSAIQVALNRIADGLYDVCTHCKGAIEADRLIALPTTILCSSCARNAAEGV